MDSPMMRCEIEAQGDGSAFLRLRGEIDLSNAEAIVGCFQTAADQGLTQILVDATAVTFIDSSGLRALIEGKRLMHERGAQLVLVPSRQLRRLLELTFPDPLFAARVDTVEEGLRLLQEGSATP